MWALVTKKGHTPPSPLRFMPLVPGAEEYLEEEALKKSEGVVRSLVAAFKDGKRSG
jgi:hypothetical protein